MDITDCSAGTFLNWRIYYIGVGWLLEETVRCKHIPSFMLPCLEGSIMEEWCAGHAHPKYSASPGHMMRVSCCMLADGILYWTPLILDGILTGNFNGKVVTGLHGMMLQDLSLLFEALCSGSESSCHA